MSNEAGSIVTIDDLQTQLAARNQEATRLRRALEFYAKHEHWMSLSEDGDCSNLIAHGRHFDGTSNGWVEAERALQES